jgi:hypothetical protein
MSVSLYGSGNTVIQAAQGTYNAGNITLGGSFASMLTSVTITPQSTNSKILLMASISDVRYAAGGYVYCTIYRNNTTNLAVGTTNNAFAMAENNGALGFTGLSMMYLDSPATTSATTYTIYAYGSGFYNNLGGQSNIIALEISGS